MARRARSSLNSSRQLEAVVRELDGGWTPGLTVLSGVDIYHLDAAQRAIVAALVPQPASGFDLTVFDDSSDVATVVAAARSVGMFAARRVVLLRSIEGFDGAPALLQEFAAKPPRDGYLIVRAPKLDGRRKLHQVLSKAGRLLVFPDDGSDPELTAREIARLGAAKGMQLTGAATALLAELSQGDYHRADAELEKLRTWLGGAEPPSRKIERDDVQAIAVGAAHRDVWKLADALLQRERGAALAALRDVLHSGEEPLRVLGALSFRVRGMLKARALIEGGMPASSALSAARMWGVPHDEMSRGLARYELRELLGFPRHLLEADTTLKSRALSASAVLERMIDRMT